MQILLSYTPDHLGETPITRYNGNMQNIHDRYRHALSSGQLKPDPAQELAITALDQVIGEAITRPAALSEGSGKRLFSFLKKSKPAENAPRGLYLYGSVGRGKTMLMDWSLQALQQAGIAAERWHFHAFMLQMHRQLNDLKASSPKAARQLDGRIHALADQWAQRVRVLCFDEFHVTDVADAMIMMPLFTRLLARGVTVIATSNWAPDDLYSGGLQRARFLPFIDTLKTRLRVVNLNGDTDYRSVKRDQQARWLCPLDGETEEEFDLLFREAVGYDPIETHEIHVGTGEASRTWTIPFASKSAARLDMAAILAQPLGAADFIALAGRYPLLFLDGLTVFTPDGRDRAKRFMVMIDVLYDHGTRLSVRAETGPEGLYPDEGSLNFEFSRTLSRLREMTKDKTV